MRGTSVRVNKFQFTYHDLAYRVRDNMLNALKAYDRNYNGLFEQPQIIEALVNILDEDQNEIKYVVSNVFRYDRDGDKAITYDQFVNFAVEQHFGEMAIQRLHRNGVYTRGKQRLMNFKEFQVTLNESLKHINSEGSTEQYQHLFNQVDLDHDGWIKYEDYFMFLREYFGSLSVAASGPVPEPVRKPQPQQFISTVDFAQQRLARLIYTQLKIVVMQHDISKSLNLKRQQVGNLLQNIFRVSPQQTPQLINLLLGNQPTIEYQKFMRVMVPFYFCQYYVQKQNINRCTQDEFIQIVRNACSFVRVKPSELILRQIYNKADFNRKGYLEKMEYINTLGHILEQFQFDGRGAGNAY